MNQHQLKLFHTVATLNSLDKASKTLDMPLSQLRAAIYLLEAQVEQRLFNRDSDAVSLTDAGKVVVEHAIAILKQYEAMEESVRFNNSETITKGMEVCK